MTWRRLLHTLRFRRITVPPIPRRNLTRYSELHAQDTRDGTRS